MLVKVWQEFVRRCGRGARRGRAVPRAVPALEPLEGREVPSATHFVLSAGGPFTAGTAFLLVVNAVDGLGATDKAYTGTVHFTSSDPQAALPPDYTFLTKDAGLHTFSATLKTAGPQTITATDVAPPNITGSLGPVPVGPAAATALVVSGFPATTAGAEQSFTVTAQDPYGNTDTNYTGTVRFFSSAFDNNLPSPYTFVATDVGRRTFSGQLNTAGLQSLIAQDTADGSLIGSQSGIIVAPGPTAGFAINGPETAEQGAALGVTVTAVDNYFNPTPGYVGTVRLSSTDPLALLPPDYSFVATDVGQHVFTGLTFQTAGSQLLTAADTGAAALTGTFAVWVDGSRSPGVTLELDSDELDVGGTADVFGTLAMASDLPVTVTLTWGDGRAVTVLTLPPGERTFEATHTYRRPSADTATGAFTIRATAADGVSPPLTGTADVVIDSVPPSVLMDAEYAVADVGETVTLTGTFTDPAGEPLTATVDFDDGSDPAPVTLRPDGTFAVSHVFTDEDVYDVTVTVSDGVDEDSDFTTVLVFFPEVEAAASTPVAPGGSVTAAAPGVTASVAHAAASARPAFLTVGRYGSVPVAPDAAGQAVLAAYEVRLAGADAGDQLVITFALPAGAAAGARLDFYDPKANAYRPVQGSTLVPDSLIFDEAGGTVTFVLDRSSFPAITQIHGTVFTVSVSLPDAGALPIIPSVATVALTPDSGTPVTFLSSGTRTLTLSPSSGGTSAAATASLSGEAQGGAGHGSDSQDRGEPPQAVASGQAAPVADPWALGGEDPFSRWLPSWGASGQGQFFPDAVPPVEAPWPLVPTGPGPVPTSPPAEPPPNDEQGAPARPVEDAYWARPLAEEAEPYFLSATAAVALSAGLAPARRKEEQSGENPYRRRPI